MSMRAARLSQVGTHPQYGQRPASDPTAATRLTLSPACWRLAAEESIVEEGIAPRQRILLHAGCWQLEADGNPAVSLGPNDTHIEISAACWQLQAEESDVGQFIEVIQIELMPGCWQLAAAQGSTEAIPFECCDRTYRPYVCATRYESICCEE